MKLYNGRWRYCNVFFVKKLVNNTSNKCLKNDWVRSNQQLNFDKTISLVPSWLVIDSHYECISAYTSKTYIVQYHKKRWQDGSDETPDSKKSRRSRKTSFDCTVCFVVNAAIRRIQEKHPDASLPRDASGLLTEILHCLICVRSMLDSF